MISVARAQADRDDVAGALWAFAGRYNSATGMPYERTKARGSVDWKGFAWAVGVVALATAIGWPLYHGLHLPHDARRPPLANTNVLMLYLLGVLWVATRYSMGAAIVASLLGVAA